jgi:hypothetical protein
MINTGRQDNFITGLADKNILARRGILCISKTGQPGLVVA